MTNNKKVLYVSYDGMTDPLGQSQVLPYLIGLSKFGYQFTILSFEKKKRLEKEADNIRNITNSAGIIWVPLPFTSRPPLLSKFYDAMRMKQKAFSLHRKNKYDMVHCRSYVASDIGLALKKRFGVKFFFDMRGFWADEKKDGGAWNQNNIIFRKVYNYYKQREAEYLKYADYIVSLTEAGKIEMETWKTFNHKVPVEVIPCCADNNLFSITDEQQKKESRKLLGIEDERLVVGYLGSLGSWYMLDEMLELFTHIKAKYKNALFFFVTHSNPDLVLNKLSKYNLTDSDLKIIEARRSEVPIYLKACDISISFIKSVYSKKSSSPTKLGEILAMGIPVICNKGVGDVEKIIKDCNAGILIGEFNKETFENVVNQLPELLKLVPSEIREKSSHWFSLDKGVELYLQSYKKVLG
jgi:glycosyltransferase involved in cell wall biosynthesis